MKKFLLVLEAICLSIYVFSQTDTAVVNDTKRFQGTLRMEYENPNTTPLSSTAKKTFKGIHFYPFNTKYAVNARFVRTPGEKPFQMSTSSGMRKTYIKYGEVFFVIDKNEYKLNVYQSQELLKSVEYKDYLFIPFTDATSAVASISFACEEDWAITCKPCWSSISVNPFS